MSDQEKRLAELQQAIRDESPSLGRKQSEHEAQLRWLEKNAKEVTTHIASVLSDEAASRALDAWQVVERELSVALVDLEREVLRACWRHGEALAEIERAGETGGGVRALRPAPEP